MADYWDQFQPDRTLPGTAGPEKSIAGAPSTGELTFEQANDPAYIDAQITQGFQQRYGRPPTPEELNQWRGYASKPDTYSDGTVHQGWNPYLMDRLVTPGHEGAADPRLAGTNTLVRGGQQQGAPGGNLSSLANGYQTGYMNSPNSSMPYASAAGPGLAAPFNQSFSAPAPGDDPGFQWALQQGQQGIERGAAAKGTLLTGGTLKDLANYTTGAALQNYDQTFKRGLDIYGTNRDTFWGNNNNIRSGLQGLAGTGFNAANQGGQNLINSAQTQGTNTLNQANANAANSVNGGNSRGQMIGSLINLGTGALAQYFTRRNGQGGQGQPGYGQGDYLPGSTNA